MKTKITIGTLITLVAFICSWTFRKDITTKFQAWNES